MVASFDPNGAPSTRAPAARLARVALAFALLLGACTAEQAAATQPQAPPPAPVEVATAEAGELTEEWVFVGDVRSLRAASLALGAAGEIDFLEVREGDRVEAGQVLLEIDEREAKARLAAAVASQREGDEELAQARRDAQRAQNLGGGVVPEAEIEQQSARADTLAARKRRFGAEIRAAKAQLSDYQLVAPFAGIIAARYVDLGQWVSPGDAVLELVAIDEVEILVGVRPELASHVRTGDRAEVRPAGGLAGRTGEAKSVEAEVIGVVPSLDPQTRTIKIRLRPAEARPWLIPGAPVDVAFPVRFATAALGGDAGAPVIVPRDALVLGAVDVRVIVIEDGQAKPIQVEILASAGDRAIVRGAGLGVGATVVTRGNERLRPGQEVRVLEPAAVGKEGSS